MAEAQETSYNPAFPVNPLVATLAQLDPPVHVMAPPPTAMQNALVGHDIALTVDADGGTVMGLRADPSQRQPTTPVLVLARTRHGPDGLHPTTKP